MILVDANLLIYSRVRTYPQHEASRDWLDAQLNGPTPVGLPWLSILAFMRVITNPRLFPRTEGFSGAWTQIRTWLESDVAWIPEPGERHADVLGSFMTMPGMSPALVSDAHLAALAIEHGLTVCSADGDFARFPGLRWHNPLTG